MLHQTASLLSSLLVKLEVLVPIHFLTTVLPLTFFIAILSLKKITVVYFAANFSRSGLVMVLVNRAWWGLLSVRFPRESWGCLGREMNRHGWLKMVLLVMRIWCLFFTLLEVMSESRLTLVLLRTHHLVMVL